MRDIIYELIEANEGLIYKIASRYTRYYSIEDLYQVGSIGIIKAYKKEIKNNEQISLFPFIAFSVCENNTTLKNICQQF